MSFPCCAARATCAFSLYSLLSLRRSGSTKNSKTLPGVYGRAVHLYLFKAPRDGAWTGGWLKLFKLGVCTPRGVNIPFNWYQFLTNTGSVRETNRWIVST